VAKTLLAATAAAMMFSAAMPGTSAAAMPLAAPSALALPASAPTPVAIVCGVGGCGPINVKRIWHPPPGFAARAAPLNMPGANPPPPSPPAKK